MAQRTIDMAGFLCRKKTIDQYDLLKGCTDCHSHILPGVDDGFKTIEDSLAVLVEYEAAGIRKVWLTPHIMEDIPNRTEDIKMAFDTLCGLYSGCVELRLASENMLDSIFEERLAAGDLLPMDSSMLLVETSYFNPPMDLHGILARTRSAGFIPVLAHPERYMYMDMKEYDSLKSEGVRFQLNIPSLCGFYGETVRKKAEVLLENDMYDMAGSDLHRRLLFGKMLDSTIRKKYAEMLRRLIIN